MKLLLAADLHIGTASSRVGEHLPPARLRTADAWFRLVDFAVDRGVDVVCLAGDVLGRLADELPEDHFKLLGRGGAWQRLTLSDAEGRAALHIDGWSFPDRYVTSDPVEACPEPPRDGVPVLGMIHGDMAHAGVRQGAGGPGDAIASPPVRHRGAARAARERWRKRRGRPVTRPTIAGCTASPCRPC